ncbi:MAG: hypothetical protein HYY52_03915 [Candidatus Melainabacteria bacterium]|nr:hypothetical protein [Candidatus Melainabacteria bacterium]
MREEARKLNLKTRSTFSAYEQIIDHQNYLKQKGILLNQKTILNHKGIKIALTHKQIKVLKLVAGGFSNEKISKELIMKKCTVKLLLYRLMKYLEDVLYERIDRFSLIIIAQELDLDRIR